MSTSNLTYKEVSFQRNKEVFEIVDRIFKHFGISYYLIGAMARDIHLFKIGQEPKRFTFDVDFAVMVPDKISYNALIKALLAEGFSKTTKPFTLRYDLKDILVDILPFGEIAQMGSVNFNQRNTEISVLGYEEVAPFTEEYTPVTGVVIPVTPFEGLIILKLVSWNDSDDRQRDLEDISHLLTQAFALFSSEIFELHNDLFDKIEAFDETIFAARVIGRKMMPILNKNQILTNEILGILEKGIQEKPKATLLEITLAEHMNKTILQTQAILQAIYDGINDKKTD